MIIWVNIKLPKGEKQHEDYGGRAKNTQIIVGGRKSLHYADYRKVKR
jgi:hypothetical protein